MRIFLNRSPHTTYNADGSQTSFAKVSDQQKHVIGSIISKPDVLMKKVKDIDPQINIPKIIVKTSLIEQRDVKQYMRETNQSFRPKSTLDIDHIQVAKHRPKKSLLNSNFSITRNHFNARRGSQTVVRARPTLDVNLTDPFDSNQYSF